MGKIIAFLALFRAGSMVDDPAKWKKRQITATMLVPVLLAALDLSRAYGVTIPLDHDSVVTLAGAFVIVVNLVLTVTTTDKIGVGPRVDGKSPPVSTTKSDEDPGN